MPFDNIPKDQQEREYKPSGKNYLNVNIAARHFDRNATKELNLNESNPGIGLEHEDGNWRQSVGYYKNSMYQPSVYALLGWSPVKIGDHLKLGVSGGGVTGYEMPITPAAGLTATYQKGDFGLNATIVPNAKMGNSKAYGFAGLQARYKLK